MRFIRRLIALLVIVTLPAYGWAALGLPEICPMQAVALAQTSDTGHGCCETAEAVDDGASQSPEGTPCKPGQQCKTGGIHHLQFPSAAAAPLAPGTIATVSETRVLSRDPAGIWRPPRPL